ncbi:MAG: hypothetical protein V3U11_00525, partial [Planctomycetota bacterium]
MAAMGKTRGILSALLFLSGLWAQAGDTQTDIQAVHHRFRLELGDQHAQVAMRVSGLGRDRLTFRMPAWKPGSYRILDFGKKVSDLTAEDARGRKLQVTEAEGPSWSVVTGGLTELTIRYRLPLKGKGAGARHSVEIPAGKREDKDKQEPKRMVYNVAYVFEGPATWMYLPGRLDVEQRVTFELPDGWNVASGMKTT